MKHLLKLLCILLIFSTISANAQKEKIEFPYSHESLTELLKDTNWLKTSAEKYIEYIDNGSLAPIVAFQSSAYTILNENEEGLKLISNDLMRIKKSAMSFADEKVLNSIMYGYYYYTLHPRKDYYYNAVKQTFEKLNPLIEDRKFMYNEQIWPDINEKTMTLLPESSNA